MLLRQIIVLGQVLALHSWSEAFLYPKDSETRTVKSLDGFWNFRLSPPSNSFLGYTEKWYLGELKETGPTIRMPVPASYNDVTVSKEIRDFVGIVWYDRVFYIPEEWGHNRRVWLRFGSVCYAAQVWVNGLLIMAHEIGHLPFEADITSFVKPGQKNLITVAVDNTLLMTTVPQGGVHEIVAGNKTILRQSYSFDFFNYAGIDRPVLLYTTPMFHIIDITVVPSMSQETGKLTYRIDHTEAHHVSCRIVLTDKESNVVAHSANCSGELTVESPKLWWPFLMDPNPGYLYEMKVEVTDGNDRDVYRLKVGIRTIHWNSSQVLINNKPIYIRGLGKHEDSDIRGKGLDLPLIVKDYELLKWLGVNAFRTSHYPYADEIMDMADEMGIMIIDECPSVDTDYFSQTLLEKHMNSLTELIRRDKNRPSVIMWSAANEPRTQQPSAGIYFGKIVDHIKSLDTTRPVTIALSRHPDEDHAAGLLDVICFNRYNSWYSETGVTDVIVTRVVNEAETWFNKFKKPIIMSEYGADAYSGLHIYPEFVWSEEYLVKVLEEHFKAFDELRRKGFFIGEMLWNFADFKTAQTVNRVGGNNKGVFTRQRQPKSAAFLLRRRYHELARELDGASLPGDLYTYSSSFSY